MCQQSGHLPVCVVTVDAMSTRDVSITVTIPIHFRMEFTSPQNRMLKTAAGSSLLQTSLADAVNKSKASTLLANLVVNER